MVASCVRPYCISSVLARCMNGTVKVHVVELQNAKAELCNDVVFLLELLLPPACHPVLGECTSGGEMYTINIFVKYASCLVVLQYLQCDSSGYHPRGIGIFLADLPVKVIRGVTWQLFHSIVRSGGRLAPHLLVLSPFGFCHLLLPCFSKLRRSKAKAFRHLATAVALHWVQGICLLLVAVVRVCQIVDASQERGCTHTDYATCSAAAGLDDTFSIATQDLVTFALRCGSGVFFWGEGVLPTCV